MRAYLTPQKLIANARRSPGRKGDPSLTSGILRSYTADMRRRYEELWRVLKQTVVTNDALGLEPARTPQGVFSAVAGGPFEFPGDQAAKARAFAAWFQKQIDSTLLEVIRGPGGAIVQNSQWQLRYIRSAYIRGLENGKFFLIQGGATPPAGSAASLLDTPLHRSEVEMLWTRSFNELNQGAATLTSNIVRTAITGVAEGWTRSKMARAMRKDVVTSFGRSKNMMRTDLTRAHAEAQLNLYTQAGVEEVIGLVSLLTAGDDRVCADCASLEDGPPIPIKQAYGIIPVHIGCRCIWVPVLK